MANQKAQNKQKLKNLYDVNLITFQYIRENIHSLTIFTICELLPFDRKVILKASLTFND